MTTLVGSVREITSHSGDGRRVLVGKVSLLIPDAGLSRIGNFGNHDRVTLSSEQIENAELVLSASPRNANLVMFYPDGGLPQYVNESFYVNGRILSWRGTDLDGFLEVNDVLHIYY